MLILALAMAPIGKPAVVSIDASYVISKLAQHFHGLRRAFAP
jgi:hypothetical protein